MRRVKLEIYGCILVCNQGVSKGLKNWLGLVTFYMPCF